MIKLHRIHRKSSTLEGLYSSNVSENMHDSRDHPSPYDDSALQKAGYDVINDSTYYYGFISFDQFRNWVYKDSWLRELDAEGFVLSIFEAEGIFGHTQAIAQIEGVDPIETLSLMDLVDIPVHEKEL